MQNENEYWSVVTGASGGIGLAMAEALAKEGRNVILVARSAQKLEQLARRLGSEYQVKTEAFVCDLSSPDETALLAKRISNLSVDTLINNAGVGLFGEFAQTSLEAELKMIQLNVASSTSLTKAVLDQMLERKSGRILNVASTAAFQPGPMMAVYYATKAYVLSFSEAIAKELEGTGVQVTTFCPGPTLSGFQDAAMAQMSKLLEPRLPSAKEAGLAGIKALNAGKRLSVHGMLNWTLVQLVRFVPRGTALALVKRGQRLLKPLAVN